LDSPFFREGAIIALKIRLAKIGFEQLTQINSPIFRQQKDSSTSPLGGNLPGSDGVGKVTRIESAAAAANCAGPEAGRGTAKIVANVADPK
jgi:hypothetical protein